MDHIDALCPLAQTPTIVQPFCKYSNSNMRIWVLSHRNVSITILGTIFIVKVILTLITIYQNYLYFLFHDSKIIHIPIIHAFVAYLFIHIYLDGPFLSILLYPFNLLKSYLASHALMPYLPYLRTKIKINNNLLFGFLDFVVVGMCVYVVIYVIL
jgi:hypothetical protein